MNPTIVAGAIIAGAIVGGAIIAGAIVGGAIIAGAIVVGANFAGAIVAGVNFAGAFVAEQLSRSNCRLQRSNCRRAIIARAYVGHSHGQIDFCIRLPSQRVPPGPSSMRKLTNDSLPGPEGRNIHEFDYISEPVYYRRTINCPPPPPPPPQKTTTTTFQIFKDKEMRGWGGGGGCRMRRSIFVSDYRS